MLDRYFILQHICLVRCKPLRHALAIIFVSATLPIITSGSSKAFAQISPDTTLGSESSTVTTNPDGFRLGGGAARGTGLFHSFLEFNIEQGQQAYFTNPAGVTDILTRITGGQPSSINGTLGVEEAANLFLLNPNGIVFGDNAQLDIAGSFTATTADSLWLGGYEFSATQPEIPSPLLTLSVPAGIQYGLVRSDRLIENRGTLMVEDRQYLTLRGGTVQNLGTLIAPGGQVELSGSEIGQIGTVETRLAEGTAGILLIDPKDIVIQAGTPTSGNVVSGALVANNVVLQADNDITVDDDVISADGNALTLQAGRSILISPNRTIALNGGSFNGQINQQPVNPAEREPGIAQFGLQLGAQILTNGGAVNITSDIFDATSQIDTTEGRIITTNNNGDSGDIRLNAIGDITVGLLDSRSLANDGGVIEVISSAGSIATVNDLLSDGNEQAGDIIIDAAENIAINGKVQTSSTGQIVDFSGTAGDITITAGRDLDLQTPGPVSSVGDIAANGLQSGQITLTSGGALTADDLRIVNRIAGEGIGKDIRISAQSMDIRQTSIGALTRDDALLVFLGIEQDATGGNIVVDVEEDVILRNSLIFNLNDLSTADAGNLILNARSLQIIRTPGFDFPLEPTAYGLASITSIAGKGGDITVTVTDSIDLIGSVAGPSTIPLEISFTELLELARTNAVIIAGSGGVGDGGTITLNTGQLTIQNGAGISTSAFLGNGGDLDIVAKDISLQGQARIFTTTDFLGQDAGNLAIQAEQITLVDGAAILTSSVSDGDAGDLSVVTDRLSIRSGSILASNTLSSGNGGDLSVQVRDYLEVAGTNPAGDISSQIASNSSGSGNSGPLNIRTNQLTIKDRGAITTATDDSGAGADIDIVAGQLQLENGQINASTTTAERGGDILIRTDESVELRGDGFRTLTEQIIEPTLNRTLGADNFTQGILTIAAGEGKAGSITITTPQFIARDGALIATTTLAGGTGGDINIADTNDLGLEGSLLVTGSFTEATSGDISLQTQRLRASDGAQVVTATFGSGQAGDLTVAASESIDLIDPTDTGIASGLLASSFETATGTGGNIQVTTGEFRIRDGATVTVSGEGQGDAGNIGIGARLLSLDQGNITATSASGEGGNIALQIDDLLVLRNGSLISTTAGQAGAGGNGGNITVGDGFIIAIPGGNSDITANAFEGDGGNIAIATQGLLGIDFRENLTPLNDITASSQFGLDGDVIIEQFNPDIEPTEAVLPDQLASTDQITARCATPANPANALITTGRGGLPTDPRQLSQGSTVLHDWRRPGESISETAAPQLTRENLTEAQDWFVDDRGQVQLVASVSQPASLNTPDCAASRGPV